MDMVGKMLAAALDIIMDRPGSTFKTCLESLIDDQQLTHLARMNKWSSDITRPLSAQDDLVSLFSRAADVKPTMVAVERCSRT